MPVGGLMAAAVVEEDGFQDGGRRLCLSLLESNWMKLLAQIIPPDDQFNYANCTALRL